jgi:hypothetical protein
MDKLFLTNMQGQFVGENLLYYKIVLEQFNMNMKKEL